MRFSLVRVAWPWSLGYFPPPIGQVFIVDDEGAILMSVQGDLLTVDK